MATNLIDELIKKAKKLKREEGSESGEIIAKGISLKSHLKEVKGRKKKLKREKRTKIQSPETRQALESNNQESIVLLLKNIEKKRLFLVSKALKPNQPKGRQTTRGKRRLETA